jgi:hypothetical protein
MKMRGIGRWTTFLCGGVATAFLLGGCHKPQEAHDHDGDHDFDEGEGGAERCATEMLAGIHGGRNRHRNPNTGPRVWLRKSAKIQIRRPK